MQGVVHILITALTACDAGGPAPQRTTTYLHECVVRQQIRPPTAFRTAGSLRAHHILILRTSVSEVTCAGRAWARGAASPEEVRVVRHDSAVEKGESGTADRVVAVQVHEEGLAHAVEVAAREQPHIDALQVREHDLERGGAEHADCGPTRRSVPYCMSMGSCSAHTPLVA